MEEVNFPTAKNRKRSILGLHISAVISMVGLQMLFILFFGAAISLKGWIMFLLEVVTYITSVCWVIPTAFEKKHYGAFAFKLLTTVLLHIFLRGLIIFKWASPFWGQLFSSEQLLLALAQVLFVLAVSFLIQFFIEIEKNRMKTENALRAYIEAMADKKRIETMAYQMQLNPHFMFNTLNAIKTHSESALPEVARAAQLLSRILRHLLINIADTRKVDLAEDISSIEDLIELYKVLGPGKRYVDMEVDVVDQRKRSMFPPGVLLTLAENVFKYGITNDPDSPACLSICIAGARFKFRTMNYKKSYPFHGMGLGLKNVKSILEYNYPMRHNLEIEEQEETYTLNLTVDL